MEKKHGVLALPQSLRIITSIVAFAVLFSVCVGLLQLLRQNDEANQRHVTGMENHVLHTQEKARQQIEALYQAAVSVHNDPALRKVALRDYGIVDELEAMSRLDNMLLSNPMLVYSYYYVRDTQRLFGQDGVAFQFPKSTAYFHPFEGVSEEQIQELLQVSDVQLHPVCRSMNSSESGVLVAALPIPLNSLHPYATLLMEISQSKFLQAIMPTNPEKGAVLVLCQNDRPILSNSNVYEVLESTGRFDDGRELFETDDREYHLFESCGKTGLSVRMYVPKESMTAGLLSPVQQWLIVLVIVLMLLLCPLLYSWTYQPMRLLLERLAQDRPSGRFVRSDYALILQEMEQLRQNNTVMQGEIGLNANRLKASLVRSLLEYEKRPEDFMRLCERADLNFRYPYFRLVLCTTREAQFDADTDEYFFQLIRENADVYAVKTPDMLYLLINAPQQESSYALVQELENLQVIESTKKSYFGRSGWVDDPALLHTLYRRSLDRLSQNLFHSAIGYSEELETDHSAETARSYPINEILQLRESAMDFDRGKMKKAVEQVQRYLLHEGTKNTVAVLAADDVLNILQRHTQTDLSELLKRVHRPSISALEVCQVLSESLELIEQADERSSADTLTEEMLLYISERLEDPNLSSASVGETFGMSESAFSHAFKKRTGSTFIKYVTDLKIQRAKSLLILTDMSVEAIAEQLCYASASSFTRMFKSVTSLTPTQYRKLGGEGELNP